MSKPTFVFFVILSLLFFSCKKKYSCDCKTTVVNSKPPTYTKTSFSSQPIGEKLSENQATSACEAIKFQLRETFSQQVIAAPEVSVFISCNIH